MQQETCYNHKDRPAIWLLAIDSNQQPVNLYYCHECADDQNFQCFNVPMKRLQPIVYRRQLGLSFFYYHEQCKPDKPDLVEVPLRDILRRTPCCGCPEYIEREEELH